MDNFQWEGTMYTAVTLEKKSVLKVMFTQKEKPAQEYGCVATQAEPPSLLPPGLSVRRSLGHQAHTWSLGGDKVSLCDQTQVRSSEPPLAPTEKPGQTQSEANTQVTPPALSECLMGSQSRPEHLLSVPEPQVWAPWEEPDFDKKNTR